MAIELAGPAWSVRTDSPDDRGRFPLGVEAVTLAHAAALAPGVTAGTAHARYYSLHARVAADIAAGPAPAGDLDPLAAARDRIRRAEVILGAVSARHTAADPPAHDRLVQPHGFGIIGPALEAAVVAGIDVGDLASRYSIQTAGFHTVYRGAEIILGLIQPPQLPQLGPTRFSGDELSLFSPIVDLSNRASVLVGDLDGIAETHCLCRVRDQADGAALRRFLFGVTTAPNSDIRSVRTRMRTSAALLLRALSGRPAAGSPVTAMEDLLCFGPELDLDELTSRVADRWRGALLRNHVVTAWRRLWHDLTQLLPATPAQAASRFSDAVVHQAGGSPTATTRSALFDRLPPRHSGDLLAPAERELTDANSTLGSLQMLALATVRGEDLKGVARGAYLTPGYSDTLGPGQTTELMQRWIDKSLADCTADLADFMLSRAQRISRRRSRWDRAGLHLPTRLRPIGEELHLAGEEGHAPASLRLERLTNLCFELGILAAAQDRWTQGPHVAVLGGA